MLVNAGANVNIKSYRAGVTALSFAVLSENIEAIKNLIDAGADVKIKDSNGSTAIKMAAMLRGDEKKYSIISEYEY